MSRSLRRRALVNHSRMKRQCMLSRLRPLRECVDFWKTKWPIRRINNWRKCRPTTRCWQNRRKLGKKLGLMTRRTWTRRRLREPIWLTSWLRIQWPQLLSLPSTAMSHTTSRDSSQRLLTKSMPLVLNKSRTTSLLQRTWRPRRMAGTCRTWQTLSTSLTTRSI